MSENHYKIISRTAAVCFPDEPRRFGEPWRTVAVHTPHEPNRTVRGSNRGQHYLCPWIASLGNTIHVKMATIKLYLTGLRSHCVDLGTAHLSAIEDPRPQRILQGIKIFHAAQETEPRKRLPITRGLLLCLVSGLDTSTYCNGGPSDGRRYQEYH